MVAGSWKPVSLKDKEVRFRENESPGDATSIRQLVSACWMHQAHRGAGRDVKEASHQACARGSETKWHGNQGSCVTQTWGSTLQKPWTIPSLEACFVYIFSLFSALLVLSCRLPFWLRSSEALGRVHHKWTTNNCQQTIFTQVSRKIHSTLNSRMWAFPTIDFIL